MGELLTDGILFVDKLLLSRGFDDYKWIRPGNIPVSYWVRMKCMYGCPDYGRNASCPPNAPTIEECKALLAEYEKAVFVHLFCDFGPKLMKDWVMRKQKELLDIEKNIFIHNMEKAFLLSFDNCNLCDKCTGSVDTCRFPYMRRPTMEAFGIDVFSLAKMLGYHISVKKDFKESTNRYALILVN